MLHRLCTARLCEEGTPMPATDWNEQNFAMSNVREAIRHSLCSRGALLAALTRMSPRRMGPPDCQHAGEDVFQDMAPGNALNNSWNWIAAGGFVEDCKPVPHGGRSIMFRDRQDAAEQLAVKLRPRLLHDLLVLAIPRGGVVLGAVLARSLHADLDVVLSRKLRAPRQPELALGALAENGTVYLDTQVRSWPEGVKQYLEVEKRFQASEIARRRNVYRGDRPPAPIAGRSVIVTDDGIATGATMMVTLDVIRDQHPRELIVAVPVCANDVLAKVRKHCDDLVVLTVPDSFFAVGQFYLDFRTVDEEEVRLLLRQFAKEAVGLAAPN